MTNEEIYAVWAPPGSPWTPWVKPVLFAHMTGGTDDQLLDWRRVNMPWAPSADERTAIILDLNEGGSLNVGLALAAKGFRPVVLYNACPGRSEVVDMHRLMRGLRDWTNDLVAMTIPPNAPPVFLLDSDRMPTKFAPPPGRFDNRWMVFPQDFPSAGFLRAHGIDRVLLVNDRDVHPAEDLAHVLLRYQLAGIPIVSMAMNDGRPAQPISVGKPSHFRAWWYRMLAMTGLRRNSVGGFGAMVPFPSEGRSSFG